MGNDRTLSVIVYILLKKTLIGILNEKNDQKYLFHPHVNNYTEITDRQFLRNVITFRT